MKIKTALEDIHVNKATELLKKIMWMSAIISISTLAILSSCQALGIAPVHFSNDLEFDGRTGYLTLNASIEATDFQDKGIMVAAWVMVYPQEQQGQNPIVGMGDYQFYLDGESEWGTKFTWVVWDLDNVGTYAISPAKFEFFTWYFVVGTWNATSGDVTLYVNGEMVNQTNGPTSIRVGMKDWFVGKNDNNHHFYGRVSNLHVYLGALSHKEINVLYEKGRESSAFIDNDIVGFWPLASTFQDYISGHDFQPIGDVRWVRSVLLLFPYDVLATSVLYYLLASILALIPFFPFIKKIKIFSPLRNNYSLYVALVLIKSLIAMITPLSLDFLNILHTSSFSTPPLGLSPGGGGFWFLVVHAFSSLWNFVPGSHPNVQALFRQPFSIYFNRVPTPAGAYLIPFFYGGGSSGLFAWVLLSKLPFIVLDVAIALVIYKIMLNITKSEKTAILTLFSWLLNPVSTMLIEMWASNDALMVLFILISIFFLLNGKKLHSSIFYGLAVAVRLVPLLFLPVMLFALTKKNADLQNALSNASLRRRAINALKPLRFMLVVAVVSIAANLPMFFVGDLPLLSDPSTSPSSLLLSGTYHFFFGITFHSPTMNLYGFRLGVTLVLLVVFSLFFAWTWDSGNMRILDSFLGLLLVFFTFSQWNAQYWLWIMPFIIMKIRLAPKFKRIFSLERFLYLLINISIFSYYYSTWGKSFFFFPNYNNVLQQLSSFLFSIWNNSIFIGLRLDELLFSAFAGVNIWIILLLVWPKIREFL